MTEQELRQEFKNHSDCYSDSSEMIHAMTEDAAIALAKAYADAQVDAAVGRAMNEVGRISVEYNTQIAAKDTEIAELKSELKWANEQLAGIKTDMQHSRLIEAAQVKEVIALNAEIKRLREFAQQCFKSPEKLAVIHYFENGEFDYCDLVPLQDAAINSLSPAPVAEDKFSASAYPKKCTPTIDQLTESDDMTMMERLEKRMPPFHGFDSSKNEDQE